MPSYTVKAGQNIYDVAMTLYGSVEGIFYLLVANDWLTLDTTLHSGMALEYSEDLILNSQIPIWFNDNGIRIKNGERSFDVTDMETLMEEHIKTQHPDQYESLQECSPDEQSMFWELMVMPRMLLAQQGQITTIIVKLRDNSHLVIDWGDYSEPTIIEGDQLHEIEHYYKGDVAHTIIFYGDFACSLLDLTESNAIHYPLDKLYITDFKSKVNLADLDKLIIPT